jgi:hypothetical protein
MSLASVDLDAFLDRGRRADDVPAREPFDPWCLRVLGAEEFAALGASSDRLSAAQLAYLAWLVVLAPSTHNVVCTRLQINESAGSLALWIDRERVLPESDPTGRQAQVSLGCSVANAALGAQSYGWDADVEVLAVPPAALLPHVPSEPRYTHVANVRFRPGGAPLGDAWVRAMLTRKVVRAEFDQQIKLDPDLPAALSAIVTRHPGLELHLITDAPTLLFLGKFQELGDATVVNRDRFAIELGHWLIEDHASDHVGMRGAEFGLSPEATRRMRLGLLRQGELLADETAAFAKVGNIGMRSSSAVAVITVDDDAPAQRIAAGRAYEEIALLLEQRGLRNAMHAAITEVDGPNLALRGRLRTRRRPTVVFRMGRPLRAEDGRRPHSSRPHLRDLLLPGEAP